jgi:hypothetical protein
MLNIKIQQKTENTNILNLTVENLPAAESLQVSYRPSNMKKPMKKFTPRYMTNPLLKNTTFGDIV